MNVEKAGFWRRFAAAFIDGLVIGVIRWVLMLLFSGTGLPWLISVAASALYFTYFHGTTGRTPGDAALSIRVVDVDGGGAIGYARAAGRWFVSIFSALVFLLGYLWMIWDAEKQTWHDKAARSYVVLDR